MHYPIKRWWRSMGRVMEKRKTESVYNVGEEKSLWEVSVIWEIQTLSVGVKWFMVCVSIYIKSVINWFYTFGTCLDKGLGWIVISPLLVLSHVLNSGKTQTQSKRKNSSNWVGLDIYPQIRVLLSYLVLRSHHNRYIE